MMKYYKSIGITMKNIGERIRSVREANNFSMTSFAKIIDISQPSLTSLENNKSKPRVDTIISLYEKFNVDPLWLLTGKTKEKKINSNTALKIGELASRLPNSEQERLLKQIEREVLIEEILSEQRKIQKVSSN